jgi:tetratricopeptide (TPR) repeat protein
MKTKFLIILAVLSVLSCTNKNADSGLELSDEQLKELLKKQRPENNNQSDMALENLKTAYLKDSSNIDNVYNLSFMYCSKCLNDSSLSECPKAMRYLSRVIKLKPDYREGKAYYNRQLCEMRLGKFEAALEDINSFIELNKKNPKPAVNFYIQKAVILEKIGKKDEACKNLKLAEKLDTAGLSDINWRSSCK